MTATVTAGPDGIRDTVSGWDFVVDPLRPSRCLLRTLPRAPLKDGEARLAIRRFALTANTMTYLAMGDAIGYWGFFPTGGPLGRVPVWGFADVVESRAASLRVGERLYGFLPMAEEFVVRPGRDGGAALEDAMPHRQVLPAAYNWYQRPALDPSADSGDEVSQAVFRPLFIASFLLDDQLTDEGLATDATVILTSASSKTASGLAWLLSGRTPRPRILGLTARANRDFVLSTGLYDAIATYDETGLDPSGPVTLVDFAGDAGLIERLHGQLGPRLVRSIRVGATHRDRWSSDPRVMPGVQPAWFFAPDRLRKRSRDWGADEFARRLAQAQAGFIHAMRGSLNVIRLGGPGDLGQAWDILLAGRTPAGAAFVLE